MSVARLICADVRAGLRSLPAKSVHCCVVSPPYWGLRSYGTEPQVWGGDPEHAHERGAIGKRHKGGPRGARGAMAGGKRSVVEAQASCKDIATDARCACGAWRGELGLEPTPDLFVAHTVEVFAEVWRVLRDDATLWINIGDSYISDAGASVRGTNCGKNVAGGQLRQPNRRSPPGLKPKDMAGIPWMLAFALRAAGWYLRSEMVWEKPNPLPESVTDRPARSHEYVFLLTKSPRYFYDPIAVRQPGSAKTQTVGTTPAKGNGTESAGGKRNAWMAENGGRYNPPDRNLRTVWRIAARPLAEEHYAAFPPELPETCIRAGTSERGVCPGCGAPWRREIERVYVNPGNRTTNGPQSMERRHQEFGSAGYAQRLERQTATTGWSPTCSCPPAEPIPATVLDPFVGAGTTLMVASRLDRDSIGIELKPEYVAMAARRIKADRPLFNEVREESLIASEPDTPTPQP